MKYYAGVGSRETPPDALKTMWKIGGTATAINVAEMNNIPVFNLYFESDLQKLRELVF